MSHNYICNCNIIFGNSLSPYIGLHLSRSSGDNCLTYSFTSPYLLFILQANINGIVEIFTDSSDITNDNFY